MIKLFLTAFIQVLLIAVSTVSLAHSFYIGVALMGFFISFTWTFNVSRISVCTMKERLVYSLGAMVGSLSGLLLTKLFI